MKLIISLPLLLIGFIVLLSGTFTWPDSNVAALLRVIFLVACVAVWLMSAGLERR